MIRYECDMCGCRLSANDPGRYIVKMEVYGAAGPIEFNQADLDRDLQAEMQTVLDELTQADPDVIEDQTYRCFRFDLCVKCHRRLLRNPLGRRDSQADSECAPAR